MAKVRKRTWSNSKGEQTAWIAAAALGAVLAFGATAAHPGRQAPRFAYRLETIDHSQQRYPTVGDWQIDKAGNLHITVSKMGDQRYEFLVGMHEAIEAYLAVHAGISSAAVDKFDEAYEATRKRGAPLDNGWPRMTLVRYDHARPQRPRHRGDAE
jgi:hypothetical protein